jgi:hypothetical protein
VTILTQGIKMCFKPLIKPYIFQFHHILSPNAGLTLKEFICQLPSSDNQDLYFIHLFVPFSAPKASF